MQAPRNEHREVERQFSNALRDELAAVVTNAIRKRSAELNRNNTGYGVGDSICSVTLKIVNFTGSLDEFIHLAHQMCASTFTDTYLLPAVLQTKNRRPSSRVRTLSSFTTFCTALGISKRLYRSCIIRIKRFGD